MTTVKNENDSDKGDKFNTNIGQHGDLSASGDVLLDTAEENVQKEEKQTNLEDEKDNLKVADQPFNIKWSGNKATIPLVTFYTKMFFERKHELKQAGHAQEMTFKCSGDAQIMRELMTGHGFREVNYKLRRYNIAWTGYHNSQRQRQMREFQIINHLFGTVNITRKDKLYKNIQKIRKTLNCNNYDIVPVSFVLNPEKRKFRKYFKDHPGIYIVKPTTLSRGRGVYLITHPREIFKSTTEEFYIVSKYIERPLLINGYKFDLRIYAAVTSFNPLVIYVYNEGLTRFATLKYKTGKEHLSDMCMHLTNYSVNVTSPNFIKNESPLEEDYGSKWTLGALLRYFRAKGENTTAIMLDIEDVIIKSLISAETAVAASTQAFQAFPRNCFEVFGFDILLDENYKPWVIEANLTPSLGCDTPLDIKVKVNMLVDLLNLIGVRWCKPNTRVHKGWFGRNFTKLHRHMRQPENYFRQTYGYYYYRCIRDRIELWRHRKKAKKRIKYFMHQQKMFPEKTTRLSPKYSRIVTPEEVAMIRRVREEGNRCGGWLRIYPQADSLDKYGHLHRYPTACNIILHQRLYPDRHKLGRNKPEDDTPSQAESNLLWEMTGVKLDSNLGKLKREYLDTLLRIKQYETPLAIVPTPAFVETYNDKAGSRRGRRELLAEISKLKQLYAILFGNINFSPDIKRKDKVNENKTNQGEENAERKPKGRDEQNKSRQLLTIQRFFSSETEKSAEEIKKEEQKEELKMLVDQERKLIDMVRIKIIEKEKTVQLQNDSVYADVTESGNITFAGIPDGHNVTLMQNFKQNPILTAAKEESSNLEKPRQVHHSPENEPNKLRRDYDSQFPQAVEGLIQLKEELGQSHYDLVNFQKQQDQNEERPEKLQKQQEQAQQNQGKEDPENLQGEDRQGFGEPQQINPNGSEQEINQPQQESDDMSGEELHVEERSLKQTRLLKTYSLFVREEIILHLRETRPVSEIQARTVLSKYLSHVKYRLLKEYKEICFDEYTRSATHLMNVLMTFIRLSSPYLSKPCTLDPNYQNLPLHLRKIVVSEHAATFLNIYNEETHCLIKEAKARLKERMASKKAPKRRPYKFVKSQKRILPFLLFDRFITYANEWDLEEFLMTYAYMYKDIGIFIGHPPNKIATEQKRTSLETEV